VSPFRRSSFLEETQYAEGMFIRRWGGRGGGRVSELCALLQAERGMVPATGETVENAAALLAALRGSWRWEASEVGEFVGGLLHVEAWDVVGVRRLSLPAGAALLLAALRRGFGWSCDAASRMLPFLAPPAKWRVGSEVAAFCAHLVNR
jgi:hypothetical protein